MRVLTRALAGAAVAGTLAVVGVQAPASADVPNFRIGVQMIDNGNMIGDMQMTPFATFTGTAGGQCSPWAGDLNTYDPDGARVMINGAPRGMLGARDVRVGIQVTDNAGTETGPVQWSPWASSGGGVSSDAFDSNRYDPDQVRVCLETRPMPAGIEIYDFRISIKAVDAGGADQAGFRQYTPWIVDGGGASPFAFDGNGYDPDGFAIGIDVF